MIDPLAVRGDRIEAARRPRFAAVDALRRGGLEAAAEQGRFTVAFDQDLGFQGAAASLAPRSAGIRLDLAAQIAHRVVLFLDLDIGNQHVTGGNAGGVHSVHSGARAAARAEAVEDRVDIGLAGAGMGS